MLKLDFAPEGRRSLKVLCLGAHCDDIEIGCGGTMLNLVEKYKESLHVYWVVLSSDPSRAEEAKKSANLFLKGAGEPRVVIKAFRNAFFPYIGAEIKEYFNELGGEFSPDLVLTHNRDDLHQDHRTVS